MATKKQKSIRLSVEAIYNARGELSLVIDGYRVSGVEPPPRGGKTIHRWAVSISDLERIVEKYKNKEVVG